MIRAHGGKFYFSTPIHLDVFDSLCYLMPGVQMNLKFLRNSDKFCLLSATDTWKIKVNDLRISTRRITIHPEILKSHREILLKEPAIYPIAMSKIQSITIAQGIAQTSLSGIFRGKLPRSVIVGFVSSAAFNGAFNKNPFLFQHFDISSFGLVVNGTLVPNTVFQPDFAAGKCMREYMHFMDNIGINHENESNMIDFETFKKNTALFAYDFSPDLCHNYHRHNDQSGYVNLELQFKTALTENINVIIYGTFNQTITIDANGKVELLP